MLRKRISRAEEELIFSGFFGFELVDLPTDIRGKQVNAALRAEAVLLEQHLTGLSGYVVTVEGEVVRMAAKERRERLNRFSRVRLLARRRGFKVSRDRYGYLPR